MRSEVTVRRPIEEVFNYVTDIPREAEWFVGMRPARPLSNVEYEFETRLFGWRFTTLMEVTDLVPPGRMTLLSRRSAIPFSATYRFEPVLGGSGTRIILEAYVIGGSVYRLLGPAFLPMLRRAIQRRFGILKHRLENA